jgi:hypothetical protein
MSVPGTYLFNVNASYSKDLNPGNNSFDQSVELYGYPDVSLGEDQLVNAESYTLDAGAGFAAYLWHDGSTGQQFVVEYDNQTPDSLYSVTVTDNNGCKTIDEVKIGFDIWDIGIIGVTSPVTSCVLTSQETLRVLIKNTGTHTVLNEQVKVTASFDDGIPVTVQQTLTQALYPGDTLEFEFGVKFDLSTQGDHYLNAFSIYGKDAVPDNDTLDMVIGHRGAPQPDLGGIDDTLEVELLPHVLNAGGDYETYVWNGVSGNRTFTATQIGWYKVEVTDLGCSGMDSVYLALSTGNHTTEYGEELKIYPNPASERIYIEYRLPSDERYFMNLFDAEGRKIMVREYKQVNEIREHLDVAGLSNGSYYLVIWSAQNHIVRQIIIQ